MAYLFYIVGNKILPTSVRVRFTPLYRLLLNKYYIDEIYDAAFVKPFLRLCQFSFKFDGAVIDGMVNGAGAAVQWFARVLRPIQSGLVQNYLLVQMIGIVLFILVLLRNI